ncbi:tRNA1(Val) (adenine(37)-N6)-methyltransferase [Hydrogenimonas sp.]
MLFYQPQSGYRFNSDSIFLYDFIRSFSPRGDLLDVGCGVGVIGLLLARDFDLRPTLVEKQPVMAAYAERNARVNGIDAKIERCDFLDYTSENRFDFIVSNPPFYHEAVIQSEDPHLHACRYNTHLPPAPFFSKVKRLLKRRGHFLFCYDASQIGDILCALGEAALTVEHLRFVHPRPQRPAKLVMVHARSDSRAKTVVLNPLVPFGEDGYGPEARQIFKNARTHTIKCRID